MNLRFLPSSGLVFSLFLGYLGIQCSAGQELVVNGDFENGATGWSIWIPDESQDKNCRFDVVSDSPHGGTSCARMQSDDFARFSIGSGATGFPVQPGDHYRVSVWVKADAAAQIRSKSPGFVIRFNLRHGNQDAEGGHLLIELGDHVARNVPADDVSKLPKKWTKVEAVVEIPAGVDTVVPSLFSWWIKGTLFVDDFSVQKVEASTPVTPVSENSSAPASASGAASNQPPPNIPATGPITSDTDLLAALNLDSPGMQDVKTATQASGGVDWNAVQKAYLNYRRNASPARWKFMPTEKPAQPREKDDALGDEVMAHHIRNGYGFQPAGADMGKDFNWTFNPVPRSDPSYSDEWTYCNVSRTEFWQPLANAYWQTGNEKYAQEWVAQLKDFALKNPMHYVPVPGVPSLWRTLDAAERISISWPNCYYHFLLSPSFGPDANWLYLKLNYEHAQLLLQGLNDPGRTGNWVATECGALYTIGTLFPEFRDAASWRQTAIDRISKELDHVVPPDGFETELTPTYHFVALTGYRQPLEMAKLNNLTVPDSFLTRIMGMYRAPVLVMDQSGHAVPTNDSTPVDIVNKAREGLQLADDPLLTWAASHGKQGQAPPDSDALPYAGFYAMRGGWARNDAFLFFRAGPTGTGHDHESKLEIVLRAWNKTLLFEPGTYTYDQSDWRRFTINTPSHSTIIVDDKWQHAGKNIPPVTEPTGNPWVTSPLFDYVAGTYDAGYQANTYRPRPFYPEVWKGVPDKSVSHTRRVLFLRPYYALVLDTLDGTQDNKAGQHAINGGWAFQKAEITDSSLPHVLLIGDSIVGGYKNGVIAALQGKANVDVWTTPKHVGDGSLNMELEQNLKNGPYAVIHFNESGLHAWQPGRIPQGKYGPYMEEYLKIMKAGAPQSKLIWATTTPVTVQGHPGQLDSLDKLISDRNATCVPIMQANGIAIDDLHQVMMSHLDLALGDRWHWNQAGFELLAKTVTDSIQAALAP